MQQGKSCVVQVLGIRASYDLQKVLHKCQLWALGYGGVAIYHAIYIADLEDGVDGVIVRY
jgi:hypothetical protein